MRSYQIEDLLSGGKTLRSGVDGDPDSLSKLSEPLPEPGPRAPPNPELGDRHLEVSLHSVAGFLLSLIIYLLQFQYNLSPNVGMNICGMHPAISSVSVIGWIFGFIGNILSDSHHNIKR